MTKSIEDYPHLKDWYSKYIVETLDLLSEFHFGFQPDEVEEKLLEMQATIDELKSAHTERVNRIIELEGETDNLNDTIDAQQERISELEKEKLNQYVVAGFTNFHQLFYMQPNEFSQDAFQNDDDSGKVYQTKEDGDFEVYVSTTTWNQLQDKLNKESK